MSLRSVGLMRRGILAGQFSLFRVQTRLPRFPDWQQPFQGTRFNYTPSLGALHHSAKLMYGSRLTAQRDCAGYRDA